MCTHSDFGFTTFSFMAFYLTTNLISKENVANAAVQFHFSMHRERRQTDGAIHSDKDTSTRVECVST